MAKPVTTLGHSRSFHNYVPLPIDQEVLVAECCPEAVVANVRRRIKHQRSCTFPEARFLTRVDLVCGLLDEWGAGHLKDFGIIRAVVVHTSSSPCSAIGQQRNSSPSSITAWLEVDWLLISS